MKALAPANTVRQRQQNKAAGMMTAGSMKNRRSAQQLPGNVHVMRAQGREEPLTGICALDEGQIPGVDVLVEGALIIKHCHTQGEHSKTNRSE